MIALDAFAGRRAAVLGMSASGRAAARALRAGGALVGAWDDDPGVLRESAAEGWPAADGAWLEASSLLVVSPGVPHLHPHPHPLVARAWRLGLPVDNDIGLLFRWLRESGARDGGVQVASVTGCNGKSTTCTLLGRVLGKAGRKATVAGNIGVPVLAIDPPAGDEVLVLELSSFQLELASLVDPDVGVLLNFADDHLGRHGGRGGYFAAKARIAESAGTAVLGIESPECRHLRSRLRALGRPVVAVGSGLEGQEGSAAVDGLSVRFSGVPGRGDGFAALPDAPAFADPGGRHNAACAAAACFALGVRPRQIEEGMEGFRGLRHRLEWLGRVGAVDVVNDSKATNAAAAARALASARRIRWIAGGRAKEGGIGELAPLFASVAKAYLIGEAAQEFSRVLAGVEHEICGGMDAAVARALAEAQPEETLLLSPACASQDQYGDFEERGDHFRALVSPHLAGAKA